MGFVCTTCHDDRTQYPTNPHVVPASHGPCEDCGKTGACYECKCPRLSPVPLRERASTADAEVRTRPAGASICNAPLYDLLEFSASKGFTVVQFDRDRDWAVVLDPVEDMWVLRYFVCPLREKKIWRIQTRI